MKTILTDADREILNTLDVKQSREGNSLVAATLDGSPLTPAQQAVVAKFEANVFPLRAALVASQEPAKTPQEPAKTEPKA